MLNELKTNKKIKTDFYKQETHQINQLLNK